MKILVIGGKGQLGQSFKLVSKEFSEFKIVFVGKETLDLSDYRTLEEYILNNEFEAVINCGAYTKVDKAEDEGKELAFLINSQGCHHLSKICKKNQATLIHFSTDYVFDGKKSSPYLETDTAKPLNVYGQSKLLGEKFILEHKKSMIFRTSWVYSPFGNNFYLTIKKLASLKPELKIISDQISAPTYAPDLAQAVLEILQDPKKSNKYGLYNFSNQGTASWYDFAWEIVNLLGLNAKVLPILSHQYPQNAKRPKFSLLSKEKFSQTFNLEISHWKNSLSRCLVQNQKKPV